MNDHGAAPVKPDGETLFETYATARGFPFVHHPKLPQSPKRPDYLLTAPSGPVLCEVEDFGIGKIVRERERQLAEKGHAEGGGNPWEEIRGQIEPACYQLKPFRGAFPLVAVLHCPDRFFIPTDTNMIHQALHGNTTLVLGGKDLKLESVIFHPDHSFLREDFRQYLSAVAVVEFDQPHRVIVEAAIEAFLEKAREQGLKDQAKWDGAHAAVEEARRANSDLDLDLKVLRIRVVHNPFAETKLLPDVFDGLYDEQTAVNPATGRYRVIWPLEAASGSRDSVSVPPVA